MSFTADSLRVDAVLPQPNHSGDVGKPCAWGIHDLECPSEQRMQSLAGPDYLQNPDEQHSVQYVRVGKWRAQGVPETVWAWGMGTPASKHTTHQEQAGYASYSRLQWLGDPTAIGTTYVKPDGTTAVYTAENAQIMRDQIDGMAGDYADWCKRWGYTPKLGTMDELARTCNGEELGIAFTHAMASQLPNTTTVHTDPGKNYPLDVFIAKALAAFNGNPVIIVEGAGGTTENPPPTPEKDWFDMATPEDLTAAVKAALTDPATLAVVAAEVTKHVLTDDFATSQKNPDGSAYVSDLRTIVGDLLKVTKKLEAKA